MKPEENGGRDTIEIWDDKGLVWDNVIKQEEK